MSASPPAQLTILIPVYNEERAILTTLEAVRGAVARMTGVTTEIVCVDDGSTDRTAELLATQTDLTIITHAANRGYGAALRTGLDHVGGEWIAILDADGTYPIDYLPELFTHAKGDVQMVVGSRHGPGIQVRKAHRMARWVLRQMVRTLTGTFVPDLNSGMRFFRRELYEEFRHLLPMGFSFTTTLTVASLYSGHRVQYVPIRYEKRIGKSNIHPVKDFFGFTVLILRLSTYFEPLKFFLPASAFFLMVAALRAARDIWVTNSIGSLAVLIVLLAVQTFFVGILADVVVRRSDTFHRAARHRRVDVRIAGPASLPGSVAVGSPEGGRPEAAGARDAVGTPAEDTPEAVGSPLAHSTPAAEGSPPAVGSPAAEGSPLAEGPPPPSSAPVG